MEMRTSGTLVDSVELVTMLGRSGERASLPARHGAVLSEGGVTRHIGHPSSDGDVTPPGAGPPGSSSAGTTTLLPTHSHPPGEFYQCGSLHLPYPSRGPSVPGG